MIQIAYQDAGGQLKTIDMVDMKREHKATATPTESPVESGANITDHVRAELESITIDAIVSDIDFTGQTNGNKTKIIFDELNALRTSRKVCTIVTPLKTYTQMVITSIGAPIEKKNAINFKIEAKEVRIVQVQTTSQNINTSQVRGRARQNAGSQQATAVQAGTASAPTRADRTALLSITDSVGAGIGASISSLFR